MRQYCTVNQREICRFPVNFTGPVFTKHIKVHCYTDCQKKKNATFVKGMQFLIGVTELFSNGVLKCYFNKFRRRLRLRLLLRIVA